MLSHITFNCYFSGMYVYGIISPEISGPSFKCLYFSSFHFFKFKWLSSMHLFYLLFLIWCTNLNISVATVRFSCFQAIWYIFVSSFLMSAITVIAVVFENKDIYNMLHQNYFIFYDCYIFFNFKHLTPSAPFALCDIIYPLQYGVSTHTLIFSFNR